MATDFDGAYAKDARVEILTEGDEYGADEIGPGHIAIAIDKGDGAFIIEGTPAQVLTWMHHARLQLDRHLLRELRRVPATPAESDDE